MKAFLTGLLSVSLFMIATYFTLETFTVTSVERFDDRSTIPPDIDRPGFVDYEKLD